MMGGGGGGGGCVAGEPFHWSPIIASVLVDPASSNESFPDYN